MTFGNGVQLFQALQMRVSSHSQVPVADHDTSWAKYCAGQYIVTLSVGTGIIKWGFGVPA